MTRNKTTNVGGAVKAAALAAVAGGALMLSACGSNAPGDAAANTQAAAPAAAAQSLRDGEVGQYETDVVTGEYESAPGVAGEYEPMPDQTGEYQPAPDQTGEYQPVPDQTGEYQPAPDQTGEYQPVPETESAPPADGGTVEVEAIEPKPGVDPDQVPAASGGDDDVAEASIEWEPIESDPPAVSGISGPEDLIPSLPCDGQGVVGTVAAVDFEEAVSRLGELEQQYPGARFGRFSEPCGPDDYVLAYWDEPTTDLDTLAQTRRSLRQPLVNVYPMDPNSPGYLVTGVCSLVTSGDGQPRLEQGVALTAEENGWLYELTDHLANQGILDHRAVTATWVDNSIDDGIRKYQSSMGLDPDGVAGPDTWAAMAGELCSGGRSISHPLDH